MRLALLHTTIRAEEKLILKACKEQNIQALPIDVRTEIYNPKSYQANFTIALQRCISTTKGLYAAKFLESLGVQVINPSSVAVICEDKFLTSLALRKNGINTPDFALVFSLQQAIEAIEQMGGFPVVIKPNTGSWGRLLAKVNDIDALEAIIEHKDVLGSPHQKAIYIQKYIKKPGRDIRVFMIDQTPICAIYRDSSHWITNTARGAKATNCPVTKDLNKIATLASNAVGGGILALDIFETDQGYSVNEINHTMEFKNSEEPTGINIAGEIVNYCKHSRG